MFHLVFYIILLYCGECTDKLHCPVLLLMALMDSSLKYLGRNHLEYKAHPEFFMPLCKTAIFYNVLYY